MKVFYRKNGRTIDMEEIKDIIFYIKIISLIIFKQSRPNPEHSNYWEKNG